MWSGGPDVECSIFPLLAYVYSTYAEEHETASSIPAIADDPIGSLSYPSVTSDPPYSIYNPTDFILVSIHHRHVKHRRQIWGNHTFCDVAGPFLLHISNDSPSPGHHASCVSTVLTVGSLSCSMNLMLSAQPVDIH